MPDPELLGREIVTLPFLEGKDYSMTQVRERIYHYLVDLPESIHDSVYKTIEIYKPESHSKINFDFVGILLPRVENDIILQSQVVVAICPKWLDVDDPNMVSNFFRGRFFSSLQRYERQRKSNKNEIMKREVFNNDIRVIGEHRSHLIDCMLKFIDDVNRLGFIQILTHVENKIKGKPNWPKTFKKGREVFVRGNPIYMKPIRTKKMAIQTEITKLHKEIYSHSVTILNRFLDIRSLNIKYNWFVQPKLKNIERKISVVEEALRKEKIYKHRERLYTMLRVLKADFRVTRRTGKEEIIGITSQGFNALWEHMLLNTLGAPKLTASLQEKIPAVKKQRKGEDFITSDKNQHRIDLMIDTGIPRRFIIADAKNYKNWENIGVKDIMKQYAYEFAILAAPDTEIEIDANVFLFPKVNSPNNETTIFQLLGRYRLDYLEQFRIEGLQNKNLMAIGVDPFTVFEEYASDNHLLKINFKQWYDEEFNSDEEE